MYIEKVSRSVRVAKKIKKEITNVLRSPRYAAKYSSLNISRVDVSKDLKNAKIFFTSFDDVLGVASERDYEKDLEKDVFQLRHNLAQVLDMKYVPNVKFFLDLEKKSHDRLDKIISDIENNQELNDE
ncbi:MAG: ribosome-binding factor A [Pseudomonadota bacterium]|nr:ribosome-binding factor A [Pseudomonadota bacterium]